MNRRRDAKYSNNNGRFGKPPRQDESEIKGNKQEQHTAAQSKYAKPTHTTWASLRIETPPQPKEIETSPPKQNLKPVFSPISTAAYIPKEVREPERNFEPVKQEKADIKQFASLDPPVLEFPNFQTTEHVEDKLYFATTNKPIEANDTITVHPTNSTILPPSDENEFYYVPVLCWVPVRKGEELASKGFRFAQLPK